MFSVISVVKNRMDDRIQTFAKQVIETESDHAVLDRWIDQAAVVSTLEEARQVFAR